MIALLVVMFFHGFQWLRNNLFSRKCYIYLVSKVFFDFCSAGGEAIIRTKLRNINGLCALLSDPFNLTMLDITDGLHCNGRSCTLGTLRTSGS